MNKSDKIMNMKNLFKDKLFTVGKKIIIRVDDYISKTEASNVFFVYKYYLVGQITEEEYIELSNLLVQE